jgi:hypothetical protein
MDVYPLDRDSVKATRWELGDPEYRIDFWQPLAPPPGGDSGLMGYKQDAYRAVAARDFTEVLSWAHEHSDGRPFVIYLMLTDNASGAGLVRLEGLDPTVTTAD